MRLGMGLRMGSQTLAGFSPASLFAPADDGWYWQPSLATTFTDTARTTSTTLGNAIGGVTDSSGKANHGLQATADARMVLRQAANDSYYYESDTTNDALQTGMNLASKRVTFAMAFKPLARTFVLLMNGPSSSPYAMLGDSGAGSTALTTAGVTLNSAYFDNVLFAGTTRGALYTAAQSAKSVIFDITTNSTAWETPSIGKLSPFGIYTPGDVFSVLAIDREITETERGDLSDSFMALVP